MPSEQHRSFIYASLIAGNAARPMAAEDFECSRCGREHWACECFSLSNHQRERGDSLTSGPVSVATRENDNGNRR